jgi:hypothetical protein
MPNFKVFIMKSATHTDPSNLFLKVTGKLQTTVTLLNEFRATPLSHSTFLYLLPST